MPTSDVVRLATLIARVRRAQARYLRLVARLERERQRVVAKG
ncbi:hypothetical protein [Luteitalea sp.]|nr:hypothetical protein [Luteitalea sp.]